MNRDKIFCASLSGHYLLNHAYEYPARTSRVSFIYNISLSCIPIITSVFFLWTQPCQAEENLNSEDAYFQDFPVVLTASRLSQPLSEAPSAMTVIDSAMIKASGFRTVPDLMRLVPGMYVGFADANRPVVSLHGATDELARRMQVLIDGRSIYLPPFGTVNWADLPLLIEDIERIEIVRGPSSASHGSNSFYGVINIITRDAISQNGASVSVTGGDASDVSGRFGKVGEQFDYRISAGYRSDQGIDNTILNDHNRTQLFNFRSNYHPNATDSFDLQLGASNGVYGMGIAGRPQNAFRETTAQNDFVQASWLHVWPASDETKLTFSHNNRRSVDPYLCFDEYICPIAQGYIRQEVYSLRNALELQNTHQFGNSNRLVWGGGMRNDYADYPIYMGRPYTVNPWQVFAHDEWRVTEATVLNIGTMYEDDGMGNRNNSPRASLNYHFMPQHTVRVGISTATRSPAMGEMYMDSNNTVLGGAYVPPATSLTPEKIISRELGYLGDFASQGVTVDARVYVDRVTDMIFIDHYLVFPADSFKNMLTAEYKGVEATLKYYWNERRSFLSVNYAYQEASFNFSSYPTQYFSTITNPVDPAKYPTLGDQVRHDYQLGLLDHFSQVVPKNSASLLLSQQLADDWQFSAGYYWREPVRVVNVTLDVTGENIMRRLDLRLGKTFKFDKGRNAEVALVVQNATQDKFTKFGTINPVAEVYFTPRAWLTAALNF